MGVHVATSRVYGHSAEQLCTWRSSRSEDNQNNPDVLGRVPTRRSAVVINYHCRGFEAVKMERGLGSCEWVNFSTAAALLQVKAKWHGAQGNVSGHDSTR